MFHGQRQFTLLQVFSWCLATSIKKVRQPCLKFCFTGYELISGYCYKLLKKKKKRPGKKGTLHQRSPSKILQMPMDGGLQLLDPQERQHVVVLP